MMRKTGDSFIKNDFCAINKHVVLLVLSFIVIPFLYACEKNSGPQFTEFNTGPFLLTWENLELIDSLITTDSILAGELNTMITGAENLLDEEFEYVTDKTILPPSGDLNDFLSLHRYAYPDEDGNYSILRDGQTNPEINDYDGPKLSKMHSSVYTLSMAYYFSGEEKYAEKAAEIIKNWFLNPETRMNPHMDYAGIRPGVSETGNGIMAANEFMKVIEAVSLLYDSPHWTSQDHYDLKKWFYDFYRWLSRRFPLDFNKQSNVSTWLDVQRTIYLLFIEEENKINSAFYVAPVTTRLEDQFAPSGFQAYEASRGIAQHYVYYNLYAYMNLSLLRKNQYEKKGLDRDWPELQNCAVNNCENNGLKPAIDDLANFIRSSGVSTFFNEDVNFNRRRYLEIFRPAALLFESEQYNDVVQSLINEGIRHPDILLSYPPLMSEN